MRPNLDEYDFKMIAIAKGWKVDGKEKPQSYPELRTRLLEIWSERVGIDMFKFGGDGISASAEEIIANHWLELNLDIKFLNLPETAKNMQPKRAYWHAYPNDLDKIGEASIWEADPNCDAGYWGNWLKAIMSNLAFRFGPSETEGAPKDAWEQFIAWQEQQPHWKNWNLKKEHENAA